MCSNVPQKGYGGEIAPRRGFFPERKFFFCNSTPPGGASNVTRGVAIFSSLSVLLSIKQFSRPALLSSHHIHDDDDEHAWVSQKFNITSPGFLSR